MECKLERQMETLRRRVLELIDTLWNVNQLMQCGVHTSKIRINRYIMECKSKTVKCEIQAKGAN